MLLSDSSGCATWSVAHPTSTESESAMISNFQIQQNVCGAYVAFLKESYPPTYERDQLLLIIQVYEWHLKRYGRTQPAPMSS